MPKYRLHYFPESGNSYKLALMLTLCGQTFEPVWTDFGGRVTRTAQCRQTVNAIVEIPVLEHAPTTAKSSSRSCAGCSGTTTSSRATLRHTATSEHSCRLRTLMCWPTFAS